MTANTKTRQLNWEDLKIFLTVYRAGNIAGAAKKLKLDDSTISRRIAQLEVYLGNKLFERTRNGMIQTKFAQEIINQLTKVELGIEGLNEIVTHEKNISGTVRIAMMEGIGSLYLAHKFAPFFHDNPNIKIELVTSPNFVRVGYREADLFLSFFKLASSSMVAQIALASSGAGIVLLPKFSIPKDTNLVPILKDEVRVKRDVFISAPSDLLNVERILKVKSFINGVFMSDHKYLNQP